MSTNNKKEKHNIPEIGGDMDGLQRGSRKKETSREKLWRVEGKVLLGWKIHPHRPRPAYVGVEPNQPAAVVPGAAAGATEGFVDISICVIFFLTLGKGQG